jgi:hypothetical protein
MEVAEEELVVPLRQIAPTLCSAITLQEDSQIAIQLNLTIVVSDSLAASSFYFA